MKKLISLFIYVTCISFSFESCATNLQATYLNDLKAISKVSGRGSNKLYSLIRESSVELQKDWSQDLALELARVYNELIEVNQNYFLVELIEPLLKNRAKEFWPIFEKALSKKNLKIFKEMQEMDKREEKEGNG